MPNWVVLLGLTMAGWLLLTVVGGILIGRVIGRFERRHARRRHQAGDASVPEEREAA